MGESTAKPGRKQAVICCPQRVSNSARCNTYIICKVIKATAKQFRHKTQSRH